MVVSKSLPSCRRVIGSGQQSGVLCCPCRLVSMILIQHRMMPQDSVYGPWPQSGEIDLAESRGNDAETYALGNNIVSSAMHWGTTYANDAWRLSSGEWGSKRTKYSDGFHTYGLEWSEKYLFTWLDGRLRVSRISKRGRCLVTDETILLCSKFSSSISPTTKISGPTGNSPPTQ
jgi:beta-glucanase (GH16 family)